MRILITGGAGCLGSNLIEHWLPQGHQISVIDNFATGKREVVPDVQGLTVVEGSVADAGLVEQVFGTFRPEVVVHAAASYKDPDDWQEDSATNVVGSAIVAKSAARHGVGRIVNFQTSLCYGRPQQVPVPRSHALAPFTSYGITKTAGEQLMMLSSVPTVSLRLANVTGPRLAIGPIPTFYKRLKAGQGCFCTDSSRDFLDMQDFLRLMDLAIKQNAPTGVFNLGTGEAHSVKEIYEIVREHLGLAPDSVRVEPVSADDVPVMMLDSSETQAAFGWKAHHSFRETIKRQLAWYDQHGVTDVFSHLKAPNAKSA
jgi:nucleoside-diphosphate-sugar epimerase